MIGLIINPLTRRISTIQYEVDEGQDYQKVIEALIGNYAHETDFDNGDALFTELQSDSPSSVLAFTFSETGQIYFGKAAILRFLPKTDFSSIYNQRFTDCSYTEEELSGLITFHNAEESQILYDSTERFM